MKAAATQRDVRPRGASRVHRRTHDIDSPEARIHKPAGNDGSVETAMLYIKALRLTLKDVQVETSKLVRYSQGVISRVALAGLEVLFDPKNGYDPYTGTNDLAASQIARLGGFCERQWQRVKLLLADLGAITFVHRSVKTGLERSPGVDQHLQISDLYYFSRENLVPWLRELFDAKVAQLKRERHAREQRDGNVRRTPLAKREKPKCRIPAVLNPVGWARCLAAATAAKANPAATIAAREAEALAYVDRLLKAGWKPTPG